MCIYRQRLSSFVIGLIFVVFLILLWAFLYFVKRDFTSMFWLIFSCLLPFGLIYQYIRYYIKLDDNKIEARTWFITKYYFWEDVGSIVEDAIWPGNLIGLSHYYIMPKENINSKRIVIWGFFENKMELLDHIIERTKPFSVKVDPVALKQLEKWNPKKSKKNHNLIFYYSLPFSTCGASFFH